MISSQQKNYYFDTCTIIDAVNRASPYHTNVKQALQRVKAGSVVSEYMEIELKVHIGICGLKNITSIISEDWHIYGRDKQGIPFIETVKKVVTRNFYRASNPKHVYTTRQGYLKQEI